METCFWSIIRSILKKSFPCIYTRKLYGHFKFNQKFPKFRSAEKQYGNFLGKFPENPENVEFPKSEPFKRKLRKFHEECNPGKKFPKISICLARLFSFPKILENAVSFD